MPLFYFEGETENLKLKADYLSGWDLSYLKFCCKVQGIRNELFASDQVAVISLTDIKSYFPPGIEFEDYWPNKVVDSALLITKNGANGGNGAGGVHGGAHWTRQPTQPPPKPSSSTAATATLVANNKPVQNPTMNSHAMYAAAQQLQAQQSSVAAAAVAAQQQQRAKQQQSAGMVANNIVYANNNVAAGNAQPGMNNSNQLNAARLLTNVWSNLSAQEQYQLRMAETNAYATNSLINYNMMRAMQGNNGQAAGAGGNGGAGGAPPPLVRGTGNQVAGGRNGNAQHM